MLNPADATLDLTATPPANRAELCEALKEFLLRFGRPAKRMIVPVCTYIDWIRLLPRKDEWGNGLSAELIEMPPSIFNCDLLLHAREFRLE